MVAADFGDIFGAIKRHRPITCKELFHYVSIDKSQHILGGEADFFCAHSNFMNDTMECWNGCIIFLEHLKSKLPSEQYATLEHNLRENAEFAKQNSAGYSYFMPYIMCTMPIKDSPYQWRNYTDRNRGGYCIGFDREGLESKILQRNQKYSQYSSLYLAPCFYIGKDNKVIEEIVSEVIAFMEKDIEVYVRKFMTGDELSALRDIIATIFTLAPLFKDEKWMHEQEIRMILSKRPVVVGEKYVKAHIADFCEHPYNLMTSITISPHGNQTDLLRNLQSRIAIEPGKIGYSLISRTVTNHYVTNNDVSDAYEKYVLSAVESNKMTAIMSQEEYSKKYPEGFSHV